MPYFGDVTIEDGYRLRVGTAVPDVKVARAAADAGISGLSFYRGIPGCVGGALRMNGGAHGRETKEVLIEAQQYRVGGVAHHLFRDRAGGGLVPSRARRRG